jgi:hypothetical protein
MRRISVESETQTLDGLSIPFFNISLTMSRTLSSRTLTSRSRTNPDWLVDIGTNPVLPTQPVADDSHQPRETDALSVRNVTSVARKDNYGALDIEAPKVRTIGPRLSGDHPVESGGRTNTMQESVLQDPKLGKLVRFPNE